MVIENLKLEFDKAVLNNEFSKARKLKSKIANLLMVEKAMAGSTNAVIELYKDSKLLNKMTPDGHPDYNLEEINMLVSYGDALMGNFEDIDFNDVESIKDHVKSGRLHIKEARAVLAFLNQTDHREVLDKLDELEERMKS